MGPWGWLGVVCVGLVCAVVVLAIAVELLRPRPRPAALRLVVTVTDNSREERVVAAAVSADPGRDSARVTWRTTEGSWQAWLETAD